MSDINDEMQRQRHDSRVADLERQLAAANQRLAQATAVEKASCDRYTELRARSTEYLQTLLDIEACLPATFFAGLPLAERIKHLADAWNRAVKVNQQVELERDALAAALDDAWGFIEERAGNYDDEGRAEFSAWVDEHKNLTPKVILTQHDAAQDAEIAGLKDTIKPLVKALTHAKTRLESLVRLICEKPEPHSNLDAAHNSARRLAIEEVAALDAALAPYKVAPVAGKGEVGDGAKH